MQVFYKLSDTIAGSVDLRNDSLLVKHQGHLNYQELNEVFPYGIDASYDEKIEFIKDSLGVSANLN